MNAVLWVGIITGGWLALSVAAGLLLAIGVRFRRALAEPLSPPAFGGAHHPGPPLHPDPSLPQQRSSVESSDVLRVVR